MSSSRMLQKSMKSSMMSAILYRLRQQSLKIAKNFASVAEQHGHLRRFRTDTVVRAVIFSFFMFLFQCFMFFHFDFFLSFFFFRTPNKGKNRRKVPVGKQTIFVHENSFFWASMERGCGVRNGPLVTPAFKFSLLFNVALIFLFLFSFLPLFSFTCFSSFHFCLVFYFFFVSGVLFSFV